MKPRIVISVINNITYDQRVEKTAETLFNNGYDILILGTQLKGEPPLFRPYSFHRIPLFFQKSFGLFAEFNLKLFFQLLFKTRKNDIVWANDLDSLLPNYFISKLKGNRLILDCHELYSELPSVQGRFSQKIWKKIEKNFIHKPQQLITVSDSIAEWMVEEYNLKRPVVIRNLPRRKTLDFKENTQNYLLYQGALNNGRGLIPLLESLPLLPLEISLKIAGDGPFLPILQNKIHQLQLQDRVEFLGKLTPENLTPITQNALAGISLEEDMGLSYQFSLPNKLFDYIQAKTPVIATFLPEIKKIVSQYSIGEVIENHQPENIAQTILLLYSKGKKSYQPFLEKASEDLVWEKQETALLQSVVSI